VRPVGANLRRVLESFQRNDGIERAMDYIFYQVAAINGFDSFGHYLRAGLIVNQCSTYAVEPAFGCSANFRSGASSSGAQAASTGAPRDPVLQRTAAALAKALGLPAPKGTAEPRKARGPRRERTRRPEKTPVAAETAPKATPAPQATPQATPQADPAPPAKDEPSKTETLLDYLFGGDE
jgi:phospholipid/cholesterol/gamma-HCH transport system substrate-binding protein